MTSDFIWGLNQTPRHINFDKPPSTKVVSFWKKYEFPALGKTWQNLAKPFAVRVASTNMFCFANCPLCRTALIQRIYHHEPRVVWQFGRKGTWSYKGRVCLDDVLGWLPSLHILSQLLQCNNVFWVLVLKTTRAARKTARVIGSKAVR